MRELPTTATDYGALHEMLTAPIRAQLMMTGIELGVFNQVESFRPADQVARELGTDPDNTRRFLDALATIDLLEKRHGLYRNLPMAQQFLTQDSPTYVGRLFQLVQKRCVEPLNDLLQLVKEGPNHQGGQEDFASENLWAEMTRGTAVWPMGGTGERVAEVLSELPGFTGFNKMLDLGGGHGIFALYIVDRHPTMKGIIYDRAPVVEVADSFIQEFGMEDRVSTVAGDYMADDIGEGYDLIWASATLNFAKQNLDALMGKIYEAVKFGGYFVSFQDGMTHEHTKPVTMLGHLADQLTTGFDFSLDQGEVAESALRCGFNWVRSRTMETPMGPLDIDIARKLTWGRIK